MNAITLEKGHFHAKDMKMRKLRGRTGPRLSDGTLFSDLFDLDKREVSLRVMHDPEIHALEMKRIFARSWVAVGHISEIPDAGDYMVRWIGEDPVIVSRGRDGQINMMLNACTHRGMEVCFAEHGNAKNFRCPYHAWIFDLDGSLLGVPFEKTMMGEDWDKSELGLPRVNVEVRHGIIFGNLSKNPVSLEEYLGDMLWYYDAVYGNYEALAIRSGGGRMLINANWKTNIDQGNGDFLHAVATHHDIVELGVFGQDFGQYSTKVSTPPHGHFMALFEPSTATDIKTPSVSQTEEQMDTRKNLPIEERGSAIMVYPNSLHYQSLMSLPDGSQVKIGRLVLSQIRGVDKMEFFGPSLVLVPKNLPEDVKEKLVNSRNRGLGNGIGAEDAEAWRSVTKAAKNPATAARAKMRYPSAGVPVTPENWKGPGVVYDGFSTDDTQWHAWLHYFDRMTIDEAA